MRTRTEITFEMDRVITIGRPRTLRWCPQCNASVAMMTIEEATVITRSDSRLIFRLIDSGQLHTSETSAGSLLICPNSL
jgi:hypothetical protein